MKIRYSTSIVFFVITLLILPKPASAANVVLSFTPLSGTYTVNQSFDVAVNLNTDGAQTSGTDVIISFDGSKLNLTDIIPGTIYDQYVGENISNSTGRATISGLANSTSTLFTGSGTFATLKFRAIETGTANVSFDYTPGNKNDTNVAEINQSGDALTSVQNATYTVSSSSSSTNPTAATGNSSSTSTTTNSQTSNNQNMPVSGSSLPALIIAAVGGFFLWLGSLLGKEA